MFTIKEAIIKIIKKEKFVQGDIIHENIYSKNECIEEMSTETLLGFSINFIEAYILDQHSQSPSRIKEYLLNYYEECEYYGIVSKKYKDVGQRLMTGKHSREDKLFFLKEKLSFDHMYLKWDCRKWVLQLLCYLYVLTVELYSFVDMEVQLKKNNTDCAGRHELKCMRIDEKGLRKNMLVCRNKPTMTLSEFADKLMTSNQIAMQKASEAEAGKKEEEEILEDIRKRDELQDDMHFMRGNTSGKG